MSSLFFIYIMALIKLYKIGYGFDGNILDITIAIPKDTYIKEFWIADQNNISANSCPFSGVNYIEKVRKTEFNMPREKAFKKLFKITGSFTEGNISYDLYTINHECTIFNNSDIKGIPVKKEDLTFVTICLEHNSNAKDYYGYGSKEILFTNSIETFTLFDHTNLKLQALKQVKFKGEECVLTDSFIDKILQIKTIELATTSRDYTRAATYWKMFYKK